MYTHTHTLTTLSAESDIMNVGSTPSLSCSDPAHRDLGSIKTGATMLLWAETKMADVCKYWPGSRDVARRCCWPTFAAQSRVSWPTTVNPVTCCCPSWQAFYHCHDNLIHNFVPFLVWRVPPVFYCHKNILIVWVKGIKYCPGKLKSFEMNRLMWISLKRAP